VIVATEASAASLIRVVPPYAVKGRATTEQATSFINNNGLASSSRP
jgi:hypothetical protein